MKRLKLIISTLVVISTSINAQQFNNGLGLGFQINQYQSDFGIGLNATSPNFFYDRMAFRVRSNIMWNEHLNKSLETTWTPYANVSVGMVGVGGYIGEHIRLYGEGGVLCILPSQNFSSEPSIIGGYGLFGFEFFMTNGYNYFIEIGGVGSGAVEDKIPGKPIYSNGLSIATGFRFYL